MALSPEKLRERANLLEQENQEMERRLRPIFKLIDKQVEKRGKAEVVMIDSSAEIARLSAEAKKKGATLDMLSEHVKRLDKSTRALKPVTRQAVDAMIAVEEERRPARTTRASRRKREPEREPAGKLNVDALA